MVVFKTFVIQNPLGLQMRDAAQLVQTLSKYKSQVVVWKGESSVNGKSLIGLVTMAAGQRTQLKFVVEGEDADEVMESLFGFFNQGIERDSPALSEPLTY